MRFFLLSCVIHALAFWGVIILTNSPGSEELSVVIELIKAPERDAELSPEASENVRPQKNISEAARALDRSEELNNLDDLKLAQTTSEKVQTSKLRKVETLSYAQELKVFLERHKSYPRQAIRLKQSGVVRIRLKIDPNGAFRGVEVVQASSFPVLNKAAVGLIKRLGNFKPLPSHIAEGSHFTVPIAYVMGGN